jgi:hypothetical protein
MRSVRLMRRAEPRPVLIRLTAAPRWGAFNGGDGGVEDLAHDRAENGHGDFPDVRMRLISQVEPRSAVAERP